MKSNILINFVEPFDSKAPQRLLHSFLVPEANNLKLLLQKFDRYDFMPFPKEVPRSDTKTKFTKSSSFIQVFGLFFVVIFTQDKQIERFCYILLDLFLSNKITVNPLFKRRVLYFSYLPL